MTGTLTALPHEPGECGGLRFCAECREAQRQKDIPDRWKPAVAQLRTEHKLKDDECATWFPDDVPDEKELDWVKSWVRRFLFCVLPESAAHLQGEFSKRFHVQEWFVFPGAVVVTAFALNEIVSSETKMVGSVETRHEQMRVNSARVSRRLPPPVEPNGRRAAIVCYGPSLAQTWVGVVGERKYQDAVIATVSGAHDFMIHRGIVPDYHLEMDPREHKADFTRNPHRDVKYLIASCVHPKTVDNLLDYDLTLWHANNGEEDQRMIGETEPDAILVNGGGSVGMKAVYVLYAMGHRTFSIYGMDCSFRREHQHAGAHSGKPQAVIEVKVGERWFLTSPILTAYAKQFMAMVKALDDAEFYLHGDGLMQHMARLSMGKAA